MTTPDEVREYAEGFQPALPLRGVAWRTRNLRAWTLIFQPALPLRGVTSQDGFKVEDLEFQPALPLRGVTS